VTGAPLRSYLYAPGDRPDLVGKALAGEADAVVVDLEDAVPADRKASARANAAAVLAERPATPVLVRVNHPASPWGRGDVAAAAGAAALRVPKVEAPGEAARVAGWLAEEGSATLVVCLLESAAGVERAFAIACASPKVVGIALGEADLAADLGVADPAGLEWARGRVVVAARAAGLEGPVQSVWTDVADLDGLAASTRAGQARGFVGRSAVHPRQVPVINAACTPPPEAVAEARALVDALEGGEGDAALVVGGRFVDAAVARQARRVLAMARLAGRDE
jgi:citrate lyase subunit beta/citryl-CoA lyase